MIINSADNASSHPLVSVPAIDIYIVLSWDVEEEISKQPLTPSIIPFTYQLHSSIQFILVNLIH